MSSAARLDFVKRQKNECTARRRRAPGFFAHMLDPARTFDRILRGLRQEALLGRWRITAAPPASAGGFTAVAIPVVSEIAFPRSGERVRAQGTFSARTTLGA